MLSICEGGSVERPLEKPIVPSDAEGRVWVYPTTSLLSSSALCKLFICYTSRSFLI